MGCYQRLCQACIAPLFGHAVFYLFPNGSDDFSCAELSAVTFFSASFRLIHLNPSPISPLVQFGYEVVEALNQLAVVWSGRQEPKKALGFLETAQGVYKACCEYRDKAAAASVEAMEGKKEEERKEEEKEKGINSSISLYKEAERWRAFERLYTHTLFYMAQV